MQNPKPKVNNRKRHSRAEQTERNLLVTECLRNVYSTVHIYLTGKAGEKSSPEFSSKASI